MSSDKSSLVLSRYLIEDNNFEYVNLNLDQGNDISVIRSIFRTLLGNYTMPEEKMERHLKHKTQNVLF